MQTREDVMRVVSAVVGTISDAGEMGAPSGPIYAALMAHGVSLEQYNRIIDMLKEKNLVRLSNHVLYYTGPNLSK